MSARAKRTLIAEQHATRVVNYIRIFTKSTNFLATDPTRRNKLLEAKQQDPSTTAIEDAPPHMFRDRVDEALEEYDRQLAVEPKTFEDHIQRSCVAYTAMLHYMHNKVYPVMRKDLALTNLYCAAKARMHREFMNELGFPSGPSPPSLAAIRSPPSSASAAAISLDDARALIQDLRSLMHCSFFFSLPEDAGGWKVTGVHFGGDGGPQYSVLFDDINTEISMGEEELLEYLKQSRRVL